MSKPETPWKVPLADVKLEPEELVAVTAVLQSGWLSMGPKTEEFEGRFAEYLGVKHCFAVANGTAALHLAVEALGLEAGDEVLCPALTFVATANAILYTGARPVFVDINGPHDLNLSVDDAAGKITERTRAVMVVHYGGYPCNMDGVRALAARHDLKIIEDCAHAPGAVYHSAQGVRMAGAMGDVGCFSFFANKNMTTGEGGMVATNDQQLADQIRTRRSHGMTTLTWHRHRGHSFSYDVVARGYNYRLDEMRAALGLVQLARLPQRNSRRGRLVRAYQEKLRSLGGIELPFLGSPPGGAYHLFPIILKDGDRAAFMQMLAQKGIQTSIHYPPVHTFSYYRRQWPPDFDHRLPRTEDAASRLVTLPLFPEMTAAQQELVVESVREFFGA
ncbi:MAG: DegT/DnrJ/EryC1/StrS family aminotransferase [Deltaproteobacteria bacterium]|nr:DegT/DnrJ/EryC1/StrS family aminotransferase [Deltaproteobacteria bacterium]